MPRRWHARTRTIPDGIYEAESYMDDDGIDIGKPVPIRVRVVVRGEEMTVDLSEVSKQVRGFYNSGITTGHACAQVAYKCLTSPTDYPINDGSFRSLKTIVPPGRIISAVRPAPMRWWMTYPMTIVDTIFKALAPAIPGRVIAGHHADLLASSFHGINNRTSEFFIGSFGPLGGGWGAKRNEDGVSGTVCINDGDTHNSPNEQAEFKFPIVVERYALVPDSGGAGRRGGLGVERVVRARTNMVVNNQSDRAHCRPWGLEGGREGSGNAVELRVAGQWKTDFPNAKVLVAQLKPGDAFKIRSGGGGGYGDPLRRPIDEVREDVRQGYVTVKSAAGSTASCSIPKPSRWTWRRPSCAPSRSPAGGARRVPSRRKYLHATAVVPAKAGTHDAPCRGLWNMDPRLRGDDIGGWACDCRSAPRSRASVAARLLDLLDQRRELTGCQRRAAAHEHALGCFRPRAPALQTEETSRARARGRTRARDRRGRASPSARAAPSPRRRRAPAPASCGGNRRASPRPPRP